jgi:hypothetical protein
VNTKPRRLLLGDRKTIKLKKRIGFDRSLFYFSRINILNEKMAIIDKGIKVNTPNGWKDVKEIGITSPNSEKIIISQEKFL